LSPTYSPDGFIAMSDKPKERVFKPVWFCIYCGDGIVKEATKRKLGAEHVIPFGLGGTQILPRASCKSCGKITGKIEETCQHMMLGPIRIGLNLPTRNPQDRPTMLTLVRKHQDGRVEQKTVPAREFPVIIPGLKLPPPQILTGAKSPGTGEFWVADPANYMKNTLADDGSALRIAQFNIHIFCQMLAKIAHSYAVAEWGFHSFRPILLDFIIRNIGDFSRWIGGDMTVTAPEPKGLHRIQAKREVIMGTEYVIVYLTLFCLVGAPEYRIVVGTWKGGH
jgi:hypothetical protein